MTKPYNYHPILFSTPMVQGIDQDRKTKTRRIQGLEKVNENPDNWKFEAFGTNPDDDNDERLYAYFTIKDTETWMYIKCPYQVGDVLWVRETFEKVPVQTASVFSADLVVKEKIRYKADDPDAFIKWKPSIFMPKEACRFFLKIKTIRVEYLQDISEEDAIAEGAIQHEKETSWLTAKYGFKMIWQKINGEESWHLNPFVWVYEFEKIEKPKNFGV